MYLLLNLPPTPLRTLTFINYIFKNSNLRSKYLRDGDGYIDVEQENRASEVMDKTLYSDENDFRRRKSDDSDDEDSESSGSGEANPGNPYTVTKNRYKQNSPWNFEMTGNHVNLHPNAPSFSKYKDDGIGNSVHARKWWYFNQDDYLPM
ncbi:uncharacterized protein LOC105386747 isoform X1 [Plutella xylostella]|uniref:uncharacterized protein LOC105386747 isoform X1 n=1 Tax=Plutella xylostella TaxID=51655 RepID=UPI0020330B75|nr:uncharacterized protein LOC105386747 isoform X1 [Plutella xylostella]XP_048481748.1 uncharacterized protein LOC105386747 isoform X1 [Plutella xylostella]